MPKNPLTKQLGACGLYCTGCIAFTDGPVCDHAQAIRDAMGPNFAAYAERFQHMHPAFRGYDGFAKLLGYLADGPCNGCRTGSCIYTACKVQHCVIERGVDFCFQCPDFPCKDHGMPDRLAKLWLINNRRMAQEGLEDYLESVASKHRYP